MYGEDSEERSLLARVAVDKDWKGLVLGAIGPVIGCYIYYQLMFADSVSMQGFYKFIHSPGILSKVISLSVLMNGIFFFMLIQWKKDKAARAVLGMTILYGVLIAYLKVIS